MSSCSVFYNTMAWYSYYSCSTLINSIYKWMKSIRRAMSKAMLSSAYMMFKFYFVSNTFISRTRIVCTCKISSQVNFVIRCWYLFKPCCTTYLSTESGRIPLSTILSISIELSFLVRNLQSIYML